MRGEHRWPLAPRVARNVGFCLRKCFTVSHVHHWRPWEIEVSEHSGPHLIRVSALLSFPYICVGLWRWKMHLDLCPSCVGFWNTPIQVTRAWLSLPKKKKVFKISCHSRSCNARQKIKEFFWGKRFWTPLQSDLLGILNLSFGPISWTFASGFANARKFVKAPTTNNTQNRIHRFASVC